MYGFKTTTCCLAKYLETSFNLRLLTSIASALCSGRCDRYHSLISPTDVSYAQTVWSIAHNRTSCSRMMNPIPILKAFWRLPNIELDLHQNHKGASYSRNSPWWIAGYTWAQFAWFSPWGWFFFPTAHRNSSKLILLLNKLLHSSSFQTLLLVKCRHF